MADLSRHQPEELSAPRRARRARRARQSDLRPGPQLGSRPRRSRTEQSRAPLVPPSQQGLCPCVECASGRTSETPTHGAYPGLPESQGQELRLFHVKQQPHNLHCNSFRRFTWNNLPSRSLASALPSPLRPLAWCGRRFRQGTGGETGDDRTYADPDGAAEALPSGLLLGQMGEEPGERGDAEPLSLSTGVRPQHLSEASPRGRSAGDD